MRDLLNTLSCSKWYWGGLASLGVMMLAVALVYQYMLDTLPCVVCIHVRLWVLGMIGVAVAGIWLHRSRVCSLVAHLFMSIMMLGILERSWLLLAIERGTAEGSCNFDSGLPSWFAVDQWFPWLFKIWEACGYTPILVFGITMAEALLVMSAFLLVLSIVLLAVRFQSPSD